MKIFESSGEFDLKILYFGSLLIKLFAVDFLVVEDSSVVFEFKVVTVGPFETLGFSARFAICAV